MTDSSEWPGDDRIRANGLMVAGRERFIDPANPDFIVEWGTDRRWRRCLDGITLPNEERCHRPTGSSMGICTFHVRRENKEIREYAFQDDVCSEEVCSGKPLAKSLCAKHYRRQARGAQMTTQNEYDVWQADQL